MATLHREAGCRFVELVAHLGAARDTVRETLASLVAHGVVIKNPGYGHPLRPEYILTAAGGQLGEPCRATVAAVREAGLVELALKKWPMLVLVAIGRGATRYGLLKEQLTGVTPRALAQALKDLERARLLRRTVDAGYPPGTAYVLTPAGARLHPVMDELVAACELSGALPRSRAAPRGVSAR